MSITISKNISLAPYTTFKIGGCAEYLVEVFTKADLVEALTFAKNNKLSLTVLGGGSNVVVADEGVAGLVIVMKNEAIDSTDTSDGVLLSAGAGTVWDDLVAHSVRHKWWGMENLSGIPGSVGAVPVQNVGAYGVEVSSLVYEVRAIHTETLEEKIFTNNACLFGYRDSFFKSKNGRLYVIYEVLFLLRPDASSLLQYKDLAEYFTKEMPSQIKIRQAVLSIRSKKFPDLRTCGTAGSFFKNPIISNEQAQLLVEKYPDIPVHTAGDMKKISAAWLIDKVAGLRGIVRGAVGTHDKQALVMVNYGGATAKDVVGFAALIIAEVKSKTGIILEPEVQFLS